MWTKVTVVALVVLGTAAFYAWKSVASYAAFPEAVAVAERAERMRGWYVVAPGGAAGLPPRAAVTLNAHARTHAGGRPSLGFAELV